MSSFIGWAHAQKDPCFPKTWWQGHTFHITGPLCGESTEPVMQNFDGFFDWITFLTNGSMSIGMESQNADVASL